MPQHSHSYSIDWNDDGWSVDGYDDDWSDDCRDDDLSVDGNEKDDDWNDDGHKSDGSSDNDHVQKSDEWNDDGHKNDDRSADGHGNKAEDLSNSEEPELPLHRPSIPDALPSYSSTDKDIDSTEYIGQICFESGSTVECEGPPMGEEIYYEYRYMIEISKEDTLRLRRLETLLLEEAPYASIVRKLENALMYKFANLVSQGSPSIQALTRITAPPQDEENGKYFDFVHVAQYFLFNSRILSLFLCYAINRRTVHTDQGRERLLRDGWKIECLHVSLIHC